MGPGKCNLNILNKCSPGKTEMEKQVKKKQKSGENRFSKEKFKVIKIGFGGGALTWGKP